jgi:hypothetical protein
VSRFFVRAGAVLVMLACMTSAGPLRAQANRTFVSGHGADTGGCGLGAPCRSFAYAITQTNTGGEITILDPAGYGPVTISKSISIVNDGVGEAGVTTTSQQDAIAISANASVVVNLRGLTLVGQGVGNHGIMMGFNGGTLNIQNCVIRGFTANGIAFFPTVSAALNVSDTVVSNNAGQGIWVGTGGITTNLSVVATFERVRSIGNSIGFLIDVSNFGAGSSLYAAATESLAADNGLQGFTLFTGQNSILPAVFSLVNSRSTSNNIGLVVNGPVATIAAMAIAQVTVDGNAAHGYFVSGGALKSFGNNYIVDAANSGSLTPISQQ